MTSIFSVIVKMIEGMAIRNSFMSYASRTQEIKYSEAFKIAKIIRNVDQI